MRRMILRVELTKQHRAPRSQVLGRRSAISARWPGSSTIDATTPHPPSDFEDTPTSSQVHGTHDTPKEQKEKEKKKEEDDEKKERGGQ
ncbi:uncharacterized protein CLUP02_06249 [Colletotrichum lupini]|uniref:Uncharacterized protein n=1 Tax=Colletotrichum lupini TaxID=145971 RepID=A0A9Q8SNS2_9PEZI|nr:uncharacterized protein CLUP02_06249 [Colletotrichum lupini]UQC80764.1 hypothetical protein CLUP02_06249 [Colletotrichum lupini]